MPTAAPAAEPPAGRALAGAERSRMEAIVGGDLSGAVLHTDSAAADRAARSGALAVTVGPDIAFARDSYQPGSPAGEALLAHELAHFRQQQGGGRAAGGHSGGLEREADSAGFRAALLLLDPDLARSLPAPRVSTGNGMRLQRCAPEHYYEIKALPSRAEYEQRGELWPIGAPTVGQFDMASTAGMLQLGTGPAPPTPAPAPLIPEPDPSAPTLSTEQLLARLVVIEAGHNRIADLTADLTSILRDEQGALLVPPLMLATIRHDLGAPAPLVLASGLPQPRWDPAVLSKWLPVAEAVQLRAYEALLGLAQTRQQEIQAHAAIENNGYELGSALAEIDTIRVGYARAAADLFDPAQGRLLTQADSSRAGLNSRLTALLLGYYQHRSTEGRDIAPALAEMRDWAWQLGTELSLLDQAAQEIRAATGRGEDVTARQHAFTAAAQLVATSLDALGEWDVALAAYEMLRDNSALWGSEAVLRVAERMSQMKNASLARDEPYLRLLVRDHRADPALRDFYASIPEILEKSHLIIGFAVLLIAAVLTAGVGVAIAGAAATAATAAEGAALAAGASASMAAAEGAVVLEIGLVAKIGGEAVVFTLVHQGLLAALPGMGPELTLSGFLTELVWNLALFGVLHGVGSMIEGGLGKAAWFKALAPTVRSAVMTGSKMAGAYATLEAYGMIRFLLEQGRWMTPSEIGTMSVQNLVMMVGLSIAMTPFEPMLQGIEARAGTAGGRGAEALIRFRQRYGERYRMLDSERVQLESRLRTRMQQNPQATKTDVADIEDTATVLDAQLQELVAQSAADPATDPAALRDGLTAVAAEIEATPVPELLQQLGIDPATDVRSTGDPATWTISPGQAEAVLAQLRARGVPVASGEVSGTPMVEATIPGRGTITLVERTGPAEPVTVPTPALDALVAKDPVAAAGLEAARDQTVVLDLAARLEARAAGEPALVRQLLRNLAQLAEGRTAAQARATARATPPPAAPAPAPATAAPVVFEALRAHTLAVEAGLADPAAARGLNSLMSTNRFQATTKAGILAAAPPENVAAFLRALNETGLSQPSEFYSVLARSQPACELVLRYGSRVLQQLVRLQPGDAIGLQLARARLDIERVLRGLDKAAAEDPAKAEALAEKVRRLGPRATYRTLDRNFDPRPPAGPAFEPAKTPEAGWDIFLDKARKYARDHPPEGGPLKDSELETRATLLQVVERARRQEFGDVTGSARREMLEEYNQQALAARLDQGWISATRGNFNEALARGGGRVSERVVFLNGRAVAGGDGTTIPDNAVPPVLPRELVPDVNGVRPVERIARHWVEWKSYELEGDLDATGVSKKARAAARGHAGEATADLTNLPPDSTLELDYAADPGPVTRVAMLRELFVEPRVVQVTFEGVTYTRADVP